MLENGMCWEGENAHLMKTTPTPQQWCFPLGGGNKDNLVAKGKTRLECRCGRQHGGLGGHRQLGKRRRPLENSRLT